MRVLIVGADGYIGFPLAMRLAARGHKVLGIDNCSRRARVQQAGGQSAIPILAFEERAEAVADHIDRAVDFRLCDVAELLVELTGDRVPLRHAAL